MYIYLIYIIIHSVLYQFVCKGLIMPVSVYTLPTLLIDPMQSNRPVIGVVMDYPKNYTVNDMLSAFNEVVDTITNGIDATYHVIGIFRGTGLPANILTAMRKIVAQAIALMQSGRVGNIVFIGSESIVYQAMTEIANGLGGGIITFVRISELEDAHHYLERMYPQRPLSDPSEEQ